MQEQASELNPPIVAIGSSAGGLEAVSQLLSNLEPSFNYAVVVLQHLSPTYKSMMPELLTRETRLRVTALEDKVTPVAGTVYVVPPNKNATVIEGELYLQDAEPEISPKPSINEFFISLAEEYQDQSVGVILSGTGSDGTAGLKAIQSAGGITIAQKPDTAKYTGMPCSAIESSVVDFVLAPDEIAKKLMSLPDALKVQQSISESVLEKIISTLNQQTNLDFSGYKVGTLSRRIRRRMVATGHPTMEVYLEWLTDTPEEIEALSKDILISVTAFFRDSDSFSSLQKNLSKNLDQLQPEDEFRVWVAGCATGEEAYTLGILVLEELLQRRIVNPVQIFATDIDEDALNFARQGIYPQQALGNIPEELIHKYFVAKPDKTFEVNKSLRDMIVFARHNVINDPPFLRINLITCRNVLIYFDNALQSKVLQRFHFALMEKGLLFLGRSESVAQAEQLFNYIDRRERLFQKSGSSHAVVDAKLTRKLTNLNIRRKESPQQLLDAVTTHLSATAALCDQEGKVLQTSGNVNEFFTFPANVIDISVFDVIHPLFKSELMAMFHQLKKSNSGQTGRPIDLNDKTWKLSLTPVRPGSDNRVLLLILPSEETVTHKNNLNVSQVYSDELQVTQEQLQSLVEELATANEEMQSLNEEAQASNEELQATNEEMEAANEELQATNEELVSVNEELSVKTSELTSLNNEYIHLYDSIDFPVLVFDSNLNLVRFNSRAAYEFNLRVNARHNNIERISFPKYAERIRDDLSIALSHGERQEAILESNDRYYQMVINPGIDETDNINFLVVSIIDITDIQNIRNELNDSEARLQTIMKNTTILIAMKDLTGRYIYINDAFKSAFNLDNVDYELRSAFDLFPPEFAAHTWASDLKAIESLKTIEAETTLDTDGILTHYSTRHQVLRDHQGKPYIIITESEDITARKKAEEKLKIAAKVYQQAGEAIFVTDKHSEIISINDAFTDITGFTEQEAVGKKIGALLNSGRHSDDFFSSMWNALAHQGHWQGEIWNKRKNGEIYPEWLTINRILNQENETDYFVSVFSDISNLKDSQRKVEFLATHDALTGLPNRSLFLDRLENSLARSKRSNNSLAVLFMDLDNFKSINDTLGHDMGDKLLVSVSEVLKTTIRDIDTVSRLGGDEFTVILNDCTPKEAQEVAERILDELSEPIELGNRKIFTSASIGISFYPEDSSDTTGLLKSADTAMYKAKEAGRNQFCFFHTEMREQLLNHSKLESSLREAMRLKLFRLVYQPQYSAIDGSVTGAEALLRWKDHQDGEISPAVFIPIAEKSSAIVELSSLVINMLCEQLARWLVNGIKPPIISFNMSAQCLKMEGYAAELVEVIDNYLVPHHFLKIEITESSLMDNSQATVQNLHILEKSGLEISIDDFGTGYSSLSYLKQLPLSELKIDKDFVDGVGNDEDDEAICKAILSMSKALRLKVVAEGVETDLQVNWLKDNGCDELQGFLFSKPLEPTDFEKLIK